MSRTLTISTSQLRHTIRRPPIAALWQQRRSLIGLGEIASVIANPAETIRQLNESREMLRKAKKDLELSQEAKRIPKKHTFAKLPGFHGRKAEQALLRKILYNSPKMSVIFGATSVGKTALLREVLATEEFFVIKFDLRISGFADLRTLYVVLCEQIQRFFEEMNDDEMDKQRITFKHLVLELLEKEKVENGGYEVSVADIASLMESLQSSLLKYWEYDPKAKYKEKDPEAHDSEFKDKPAERKLDPVEEKENLTPAEAVEAKKEDSIEDESEDEKPDVFKKRPLVFLLDEAHKLPALVNDQLSLKVFLDTLLVLTKQDRLCHVILSTSDSFFHHFLRQMNVGHHAQILTVGDSTKQETYSYFQEQMMPTIPDNLKPKINFDQIYNIFGGKLSHINDYINSWVNSDGKMTPYTSTIFLQAYTLLQFHITHSDFETFSPLSTATSGTSTEKDQAGFSPKDLLAVMKKLTKPPYSMPYFRLCREIGTEQVDSLIRTRILELRWTGTVVPEEDGVERVWSEDGVERPIVLPMTRVIRKAMEIVLREEEDYAEETAEGAKSSP